MTTYYQHPRAGQRVDDSSHVADDEKQTDQESHNVNEVDPTSCDTHSKRVGGKSHTKNADKGENNLQNFHQAGNCLHILESTRDCRHSSKTTRVRRREVNKGLHLTFACAISIAISVRE